MRSVSSAIISFVIFYMGLCWSKKERKDRIARSVLFSISYMMLVVAFILMIFGL